MKWTLEEDFGLQCAWLPDFECKWGNVENGWLTIYKGYAWDGCTPKFNWGFFSFGVWDGNLDLLTGKQRCYHASMVHDFLYQYRIGTRRQADRKFHAMLYGFKLQRLYYRAVRMFGNRRGWK